MDTVILAAGKGERLNGIAAAFHKPLLVVSGKPIVTQAVDFATQLGGTPIVVVAPENVGPISDVLGARHVRMVVQRRPRGPGEALALGLEMARGEKVMVLMGDNISTFADVKSVASAKGYGIGVQYVSREEARRFTWYSCGSGTWAEKIDPVQADLDPSVGMALAWVGPLMVDREEALQYYRQHGEDDGWVIGPALDRLAGTSHTHVAVSTYDIGVPEAFV